MAEVGPTVQPGEATWDLPGSGTFCPGSRPRLPVLLVDRKEDVVMSTSIKGAIGLVLAMLLAAPGALPASPLTISGQPRQINTFNSSGYACMNAVASGGAGSYRWDLPNNPGTHFTIDGTYGSVRPVGALAAGDYPITVRVSDLNNDTATEDVVVSVVSTGLIVVNADTIFDNYAGNGWFSGVGIYATGFANSASGTTWTITDPSGYFGVATGYNFLTLKKGVPPIGDYPISLSLTQAAGTLGPVNFTIHVVPAQKITSITFIQNAVSTSQGIGVAAGTASAIIFEPGYQWSIPSAGSDNGTFAIPDAATGVVTLAKPPALGDRSITIQVKDGLNTYSQAVTVHVVDGTVLPSSNLSLAVPPNLDNYMRSGVLGTPAVTGLSGTQSWSFTGDGVGYRYAIDPVTGTITIIGALSYNPTIDGVDYSDVLTVTCTDGVNTCTNSFRIPVAACVGPVLNVGPGQTYAHLNDAIAYVHSRGWGRPYAGVTFNVYPSSDPDYYRNDGQVSPINGVFRVPATIQGAPGQKFPKFCGSGLYYAKGFFMATTMTYGSRTWRSRTSPPAATAPAMTTTPAWSRNRAATRAISSWTTSTSTTARTASPGGRAAPSGSSRTDASRTVGPARPGTPTTSTSRAISLSSRTS